MRNVSIFKTCVDKMITAWIVRSITKCKHRDYSIVVLFWDTDRDKSTGGRTLQRQGSLSKYETVIWHCYMLTISREFNYFRMDSITSGGSILN